MRRTFHRATVLLPLMTAVPTFAGRAATQEPTSALSSIEAPVPNVSERFTLHGELVRTAYDDEGFVNLGYRIANGSLGEEWMYLFADLGKGTPSPSTTSRWRTTRPPSAASSSGSLAASSPGSTGSS